MEPPRTALPNARAMRVIHLALTLGLTGCGVVFFSARVGSSRVIRKPEIPYGI